MNSRRRFLKTSSTALALAPFMQHMRAHAAGDASMLPKRFVFVMRGNGLRPFGVVPEGLEEFGADRFKAEKLIDRPLGDLSLNQKDSEHLTV